MANYPDRCQHLKINGTQCGSPALRRNRFCYFHKRFQDQRIRLASDRKRHGSGTFILPLLEDDNSIQIALMQVMRLLVSQQIEHKTASLLLYALQTASTNLRMTDFKPYLHDVILDPRDAPNNLLDERLWTDEEFEDEQTEAESAADRAIAELERTRKEKVENAKWRKWAEMKYPDPDKVTAPIAPAKPAETTAQKPPTPEKPPQVEQKKPASSMSTAEIRQEIVDMVRKSGIPEMYAAKLAAEKEKRGT
jgi:hypothetical protein